MTKQTEAMKLALDALEQYASHRMGSDFGRKAITALREALAEQPAQQQEPAFWTRKQWGMDREFCEKPFTTDWEPLYTSPPAQRTWVGLTNQERENVIDNSLTPACVVLATEAKLKEKNT